MASFFPRLVLTILPNEEDSPLIGGARASENDKISIPSDFIMKAKKK
tara:strand:- start:683 stop:823 length:141 start_codon:yes stop_codon:yes gene_type:complete